MKQSFARQQSQRRNRTPSVIYLPPPKPPVMAKPPSTSERVANPPTSAEQPPVEADSGAAQRLSRQARRTAMRAEAKALRRSGHAPVTAAVASAPPAPSIEADRPLPPARALVPAKQGGLALFGRRLRTLFGFAVDSSPARAGPADSALANQLRTLRVELAALQQSLDRMIDGAAA